MSITLWILYAVVVIAVTLYIVGFAKNITILQNISSSLVLPSVGSANILLLVSLLPDSYHTIIFTGITYLLAIFTQIIFIFEKKKNINIIAKISFLLILLSWINLYVSAFYIYRVSNITISLFSIIILALAIVVFILCGKQKLNFYIHTFIGIIFSGLLDLFAFIFLLNTKTTSAILLFAGASVSIALVIFYTLDTSKFNFKLGKPIRLLLFIGFQVLISYSNFLTLK